MTGKTGTEGVARSMVAATVAIGAGIGCINALQPILLGSMLDAGRLSVTQIGQGATAELTGMALATTVAALRLEPVALRRRAAVALVAMLAANLLTPAMHGGAVLACRFVNGMGTGFLFWIFVGLVSRSATPGRLFAIYISVQATGALLLSMLLSSVLVPRLGPLGGYGTLAAIDLGLLLFAMPRIATGYGGEQAQRGGLPPAAGLLALASVGCLLGGIMALWVYALPLFRALGHGDAASHVAISAAIGCQIAGGVLSSILAERLRPLPVCIGAALVCIGCVLTIFLLRADMVLNVAMGIYALCWMGVPAFQLPLLIRLDPSLRAVLLIGSAQMLGLSLTPVIASAFISHHGVTAVAWVAVAFMAISILVLLLAMATARAASARSEVAPAPPGC
ncbi:hypothetical protein [Rhizorhabdus dicambivorans]|uniref:MFS transporter n=1 Tax=Rhizorhabdus dicambivorans TaxID=1850238 RepID=A0A2A4FVK5_9SPHN|nr:hypothetical protein [Rhizorhabdus dicambivorans]ATE66205.1 hypothetical protein CMV14_18850 [Rhizorhabdus dicambivorans]PCE41716.1 hypothetical protein COO09_13190 [Rhizorhabdus dicambivorans]